ncbi:uncharacterized protein LOC142355820, partial [Convolutriloba macropyga]|uniref:uncharacterized protein LOC142355820 n=1 Tax=Convolutriloba macropyga TaxID=536237 RepID=UPI003F525942
LCCEFQTITYLSQGQAKGLSASEYMEKMSAFNENDGKQLNYILASYNEELCLNVIHHLGFGFGSRLELAGDFVQQNIFIIILDHYQQVTMYEWPIEKTRITFKWFKESFICEEHPRFCQ